MCFLFLISFQQVFAQSATSANINGSSSIRTIVNNTSSIVDSNIVLTANGNITGFTVSITGSYTSGDVLGVTGTLPSGITVATFNTATRSLVFSGTTTPANWQALMRTVTLTTTSAVCNPESRLISFVVGIKYYNILNGHFYEYYATGTSWTGAKAYASGYSYFGREGYLATIDAQSENSFSFVLVGQNSWIGCSDNYAEINAALGYTAFANQTAADGNFYWITGPERGQKISAQNAWASGGVLPVSGVYNNWSSGEPNDYPNNGTVGEEDYGHMYTGTGLWNDFPNTSSIGSIIEFGGMPNDNTSSKVVTTRSVYINGAPSGTITGGNISVCSGTNSTALTLTGLSGTVARWESSLDNFLTAATSIGNTTTTYTATNITTTTYYRAVVNTASGCSSLATSSTPIYVNKTIAGNIVAANNTICAGASASFNLYGNTGSILKWQVSTSSTFASAVTDISNTTTAMSYALGSTGTYYFRASIQNNGCGSAVFTPGYTITVTSGTAPIGGSVSNAEHCGGSNSGTLTLSSYTGTIAKWQYSIDGGIIWTNVANTTASLAYSSVSANRLYRAQLVNGSCGNAYSSYGTITVYGTTVCRWDGGTSNAWQTASNWCGGVADNGLDVVISSSSTNSVILDQTRIIGNLNFNGANRTIDIGNYNLTASSFSNANSSNYIKTTGTGVVKTNISNLSSTTIPVGKSTYNPLKITNNTGSNDYFSVRVYDKVYFNGYSGDTSRDGHVRHTWDIGKTNPNAGSGLNFVFNWNAGEAYNISTATLFHFDGAYWVKQTGTTSSTSTSLTYTGYTGTFSPFGIGNPLTSLPVMLINFEGKALQESHASLIKWATTDEVENAYFEVQKSIDGLHWQTIGTVNAKNNSAGINNYEYIDPTTSDINFYRLNQVDMDGKSSLSNMIKIDFKSKQNEIVKVYPNPSKGIVNIETSELANYSIMDINGKEIVSGIVNGQTELNQLPAGMYMVKITMFDSIKNIKLIIQ
ncbi:MAG: T9SS type A sorting domain-containing protein [bacterium]|nr:T9SS type A sorting domain-containing protein [bacterium]